MAKKICLVLGIAFLLIGVAGFVMPGFLGTHLSLAHNLIHIVSGAAALYFGTAGTVSAARTFCIIFGVVYGLLGVAGFLLGHGDSPSVAGMQDMPADPRLFKVIPGVLELGTRDHLLHILLGVVFLVAGLSTKPQGS